MRTGAEYRQALRDGRRVWVLGEGLVDDVTTHSATRAMIDEYVACYDLHLDPAWRNIALRPGDATPWAYVAPRSAHDLTGMGRFFSATTFLSAGNITHTPCYGHLIALGLLCSLQEHNVSPEQIAAAAQYREMIACTGRFLTFCGGAPNIGTRMRADPRERVAMKIARETDAYMALALQAADVVLEQDPVATHELAGPADGLAHAHGAERLGHGRLLVGHPAGVLQLPVSSHPVGKHQHHIIRAGVAIHRDTVERVIRCLLQRRPRGVDSGALERLHPQLANHVAVDGEVAQLQAVLVLLLQELLHGLHARVAGL